MAILFGVLLTLLIVGIIAFDADVVLGILYGSILTALLFITWPY